MVMDPRIAVMEQYTKAMQAEADATKILHEAVQARTEAESVIGSHILDNECWVYGDIAIVLDSVTRQVRGLRVIHLG